MANEDDNLDEPKGSGKKAFGILLLCLGLIGSPVCWLYAMGEGSAERYGASFTYLVASILFGILAIVGIILFFIGWSQAKQQKNQNSSSSTD